MKLLIGLFSGFVLLIGCAQPQYRVACLFVLFVLVLLHPSKE